MDLRRLFGSSRRKGRGRRGVRRGGPRRRDPGSETEYIAVPPAPPAPGPARAVPAAGATELSPTAPPPRPAQAPPAPPPPAAAPPPAAGDAGRTRYVTVPGAASHEGVVGVLIGIDGELRNEVFRLFDGENMLGRGEGNRVVLRSEWISRQHAMILHQDEFFGLKALKGDDNPVLVNGEKVDEAITLSDGDSISLGKTTLKFRTV